METTEQNQLPASILTKAQKLKFGPKVYTEDGTTYRITAEVRHDDQCGNGHNSFGITAAIYRNEGSRWMEDAFGCCHEEIAKHFPKLAPLIKWHLTSTDGPMHYLANTLYHAGDRDCHGLRKGEFRHFKSHGPRQNGGIEGVPNWTLEIPSHEARDVYATEKPAPVMLEWKAYGRTGEGKTPDLESARHCAVWPDATLEQLQDKRALVERLPALMAEFKAAVESLGLTY